MARGSGKRLTEEQTAAICDAYVRGESAPSIAARFGKSGVAIRGVLRRKCVPQRSYSDTHRGWTLKVGAFASPLSPSARYWLGVLLSDGYVLQGDPASAPRVGVSMVAPDGEYLGQFAAFIGMPAARARRKKRRVGRDMFVVDARSRELCAILAPYGLVPNKSLVVDPPAELRLDPDFWRGMVDGDGSVTVGTDGPSVQLTGTEETCLAFADWAHSVFPAHLASVGPSNRTSYCVSVSYEVAKAVMSALYERPGPAMPRKALAAAEALAKWKNRTFRVMDQSDRVDMGSPIPFKTPTLDQGRREYRALQLLQPSDVIQAGTAGFRHYDGALRPSAKLKPASIASYAGRCLSDPIRFQCGHLGWRSPAAVWADQDTKQKIINRSRGIRVNAAAQLRQHAYVASNYNPGAVVAILRRYGAKSLLDPCAGWGDRLVGAGAAGVSYQGFDPSPLMEPVYRQIIDLHGIPNASVQRLPFEKVSPAEETFDMALTSPPYWDTEIYDSDPEQALNYPTYAAWRDGFYLPMLAKMVRSVKSGGRVVITVANVMRKGDVLPLIEDAGAFMVHQGVKLDDVLALMYRGNRGKKNSVILSEPTLVWRKL